METVTQMDVLRLVENMGFYWLFLGSVYDVQVDPNEFQRGSVAPRNFQWLSILL